MTLPSPEIQKMIAGPAITDALNRGLSYQLQSMMLSVNPQTLRDIHEGVGTKNKFDWERIEKELKN